MGCSTKFDPLKIKEIDGNVKNKFNLKWLEKSVDVVFGKDKISVRLGDDFTKSDLPGQALCKLCSKQINYGSRGVVAMEDHVKSAKHISLLKEKRSSYNVVNMIKQYQNVPVSTSIPGSTSTNTPATTPTIVPMCDRISNAEALLLGVMSEHSMPFTYAPVLVDLAKSLALDPKALSQLSMDRTTASYKTTHGLAEGFKEKLLNNLRTRPFSMNIDESTSKSNKHVLAVLVSFYDGQSVVCEHWTSTEVIKLDSASISGVIVDLMEKNDVPWKNLVSILMDSCNVMRGKKSGVETRIRNEKAPHLLDIDGDSCHHIHNSCKKFCAPFGRYLEDLFTDLYNDFKWSSDQAELLAEICDLLGIKFTKPERFIDHRWLAAYDLSLSTDILMDAYIVFYHAFLCKEDKTVYLSKLIEVFQRRNVSKESRDRMREIRSELSKKKMTDFGKDRKKRVTAKLFHTDQKTRIQMSFYQETLPIMKSYVLTFQSKDVMVHQLHDRQLETFLSYLACFIKAEYLVGKTAKQLQDLDLTLDDGQFMKIKDMFVGAKIRKMMRESSKGDPVLEEFLKTASAAYIGCAKHMQKTLPLNSKVLQSLSCVDPAVRHHSLGSKGLQDLCSFFSFMLTEEEESTALREITRYSVDSAIPEQEDVVQWWNSVEKCTKYPILCKVVFGALSIFHGPMVESSFNVMGDVIGAKTASLNVETYSSIQTIKYGLRARKTTALRLFRRKNPVTDPVDRHICIKLRTAAVRFKKRQEQARNKLEERLKKFGADRKKTSKSEMKLNFQASHEANYARHVEVEAKRAKKRLMEARLQKLCAKKQKQV